MMATTARDQLYGTYRCPVCGHRDAIELSADESSRILDCSYCDTALEVTTRGRDAVRLAVQVVGEAA
ncbi:MAG: hypothetical protein FIB01_01135 [Gemmatimonadetes bacterium]|nr:hypothetical protein [Gemmatimonadota bacterium]